MGKKGVLWEFRGFLLDKVGNTYIMIVAKHNVGSSALQVLPRGEYS